MSLQKLHEAFGELLELIDQEKKEIAESQEKLRADSTGFEARVNAERDKWTKQELDLLERERQLENKFKAVYEIREIASNRLNEINSLKEALQREKDSRIKADSERKQAILEKEKLESLYFSLLREKKERETAQKAMVPLE
jgi:hypothetical protein